MSHAAVGDTRVAAHRWQHGTQAAQRRHTHGTAARSAEFRALDRETDPDLDVALCLCYVCLQDINGQNEAQFYASISLYPCIEAEFRMYRRNHHARDVGLR